MSLSEVGKSKLRLMLPAFESRLDEYYKKAQQYPLTESKAYENNLYFVKELGCKVYRNSQGLHKIVIKDE